MAAQASNSTSPSPSKLSFSHSFQAKPGRHITNEDGRTMSIYWWWYRVKKRIWEEKIGGNKEVPNVST